MDGCELRPGGYQYTYGVNYARDALDTDGNICQAKILDQVSGWFTVTEENELWWDRFGNP